MNNRCFRLPKLLLAAPGCSWLRLAARLSPLAAPGCSWLLLAAPGCSWFSWLLLAAPGCSWLLLGSWLLLALFLAAPGCSWLLLVGSWLLLASPGCSCFSWLFVAAGSSLLLLAPLLAVRGCSWVGPLASGCSWLLLVLANPECCILVHFVLASFFFVLVCSSFDHCGSVFIHEVGVFSFFRLSILSVCFFFGLFV